VYVCAVYVCVLLVQDAGACAGEGSAKVDVGVVCRVVAASIAFFGQPHVHKVSMGVHITARGSRSRRMLSGDATPMHPRAFQGLGYPFLCGRAAFCLHTES
jgi:hypothetical protein